MNFKTLTLWLVASATFAQQTIPLNDLSAFKTPKENWRIVGKASSDLSQDNILNTETGTGILACVHPRGKYGYEYDLVSKMEHGDIDLDLDFMMAKGSNSGIYLQSRYEVQLADSWGKQNPYFGDCGGIYERWDDSKPEGKKGYEGTAPRLNVSKAPGLWQNIKISFQAPRFDASGKKISNAKILYIILNGVTIHENVELTGPTRGTLDEKEALMGALRIQGDHGSVAFRNIKYKSYNQKKLSFTDLKYGVYKGKFTVVDDIEKLKPSTQGNAELLNWTVTNAENDFGVKYVGKINVPEAGLYTFTTVHAGNTQIKINGQEAFKNGWLFTTAQGRSATVNLPAGEVPFEMYYWKTDGWMQPILGLYAESETIRKHALHFPSSTIASEPIPMILANTEAQPVLLRSFMDIQENGKNKRVVHAVSVGNKENIHFTYDLDNGALFQAWKGGFLNTTPMWNDRGDGSSKPMGSLVSFGDAPSVGHLAPQEMVWNDKVDASYRPRGYELDTDGQPTFKYDAFGGSITDKIVPAENGKMLNREINGTGALPNVFHRIAANSVITKANDGTFVIGDNQYYIKVSQGNASIRVSGDKQELIVPINSKVVYSIIW
ncbi:MAG: DUF1080 domain-containing protein [Spirosomaceae bacterium]|jgi:hypothetical protein|nr:DUF1080 domain-containing protein [Spirosomataceae bacterium]